MGKGCACASCYPGPPVPTDEQYKSWMQKLGELEIEGAKTVYQAVKKRLQDG